MLFILWCHIDDTRLQKEFEFFSPLEKEDTIQAFTTYLQRYPKGYYADRARKAVQAIYDAAWKKATDADTIPGYENYLASFPQGPCAKAAQDRIYEIAWQAARASGTPEAFQAYLAKYPMGSPHADEAKQEIEDRLWGRSQSNHSVADLQWLINDYPNSRYIDKAKTQLENLQKQIEISRVLSQLPPAQQRFVSIIEDAFSQYKRANNELVKTQIRRDRAASLATLIPTRQVERWLGSVTSLGTNSQGKAYVEIQLLGSDRIIFRTMNNAFSDVGAKTLISGASTVYRTMMPLSVGSAVSFSGKFLPDEVDFIREISITEGGSISAPEYLMRFTEIAARR